MQLCSQTFDQLQHHLSSSGCNRWRAGQVWQWLYARGANQVSEMRNVGEETQRALDQFNYPSITLCEQQLSSDQNTVKSLWRLGDDALIESVLITAPDRLTLCISSQVGCPARCAFCASGKEGLIRDLTTGEIVEQVLHTQKLLKRQKKSISNIVFMGMGEPLANCDAVMSALSILTDPKGLNFSPRRITISTVGVTEGIQRLLSEEISVNLVLSLHAPNQRLRQKLLPFARRYPLDELMPICDAYFAKTGREVGFEYILIKDLNDQIKHAEELSALLGERKTCVNLIPYNPVEGISLQRPDTLVIERFQHALMRSGTRTTRRYTKGDDIAAACGQLALRKKAAIGASSP